MSTFTALVVEKDDAGQRASVRDADDGLLSPGDATIDVACSTINYKDALAITGRSPILRRFPMIPGIDLAGTVTSIDGAGTGVGDRVLVNGYGVGEGHSGGLARRARMKSEWLVPVPAAFTFAQAMAIGTAGYTAMLAILALERHGIAPGDGEVLVTGAAGGVGSIAISVLAKLGHRVVASTGRPDETPYLTALGAAEVIDRATLASPGKPLAKERWAAAIDTVGSHTLANACAATGLHGVVAACGLAQGMDFPATVAPFILRGVTLVGIDSVQCPMAERRVAWERLARDLDPEHLARMTSTIGLGDAIAKADELLAGRVRGRVVVDLARA